MRDESGWILAWRPCLSHGQAPVSFWQPHWASQDLAKVFWAPALSISYSCLGRIEADTLIFLYSFLSLNRCQHLKVNNIQEGSGVRAASGLSLSPQTKPVRAWIGPVSSAERSWATVAPGLDITSSAGAAAVTKKRGLASVQQGSCWAPSSQRPILTVWGLNGWPNEPIIPCT